MKQVFKLSFMAAILAATTLFTSCSKDDDIDNPDKPKPSLTVEVLDYTGTDITVEQDEVIAFKWNAIKAGGGADLKEFSITQQGANNLSPLPATFKDVTIPYTIKSAHKNQYVDTLAIPAGSNLGVTTYTFKVTDKDGIVISKDIKVTVVEPAGEGTDFENEEEGSFYHIQGSKEGAYDLVSDALVASTGNDDNKDMVNSDAMGEDFTGSFTSKNGTEFVKANDFDFENATVESAIEAFENGTASATVSNPEEGDIYIANLRGGDDYVVILITKVDADNNDCDCVNKGKISFTYLK